MDNSLQDAAIKYIEEDINTAFARLVIEWERRSSHPLTVDEYAGLCGAYDIGHYEGCRIIRSTP